MKEGLISDASNVFVSNIKITACGRPLSVISYYLIMIIFGILLFCSYFNDYSMDLIYT